MGRCRTLPGQESRAMMHMQGYVSKELSHFVGKDLGEEDQYALLVKILKSGWLTHAPHDHTLARTVSLDLSKPMSTDEAVKYQVVCFCDIPVANLSLHMRKYSTFGLAFTKQFVIGRGAWPVHYIA